MLILCIGPDTFRAQAKVRELEVAFKKKYDPSGSSAERVSPGKDGVDEVMERANTISLFSSHRFLRASNLIGECPKNKQAALAKALARDSDHVIVVSVEDAVPNVTALKPFEKEVKIIKYEFPEQVGVAFDRWVQDIAKVMGIQDDRAIKMIAEETEGDSWYAMNELTKLAAGGTADVVSSAESPTSYMYADAYLRGQVDQYKFLQDEISSAPLLSLFLSQSRAALRVRDRATEGLHPYMVKKMSALPSQNLEEKFAHTLLALFCQRAGYAAEDEGTLLF